MAQFSVKFQEKNKLFDVGFSDTNEFNVTFGVNDINEFDATFGNVGYTILSDIEVYNGSYEATPTVNEQSLLTAKKFMEDDVTIKAIPYYDTANTSGGNTVYIGGYI